MSTITIPAWAQGRSGRGQGGYTSRRFQHAIGEPVSISLKAPIPLESELGVTATEGGWELRHGETIVMSAAPSTVSFADTSPVTIEAAADARTRFPVTPETHNAPHCRSCGFQAGTMRVWPGLLADDTGRVASDFTPPAWAADADGIIDEGLMWMALDCACGFYVGHHPEPRNAVTVQYAVEVMAPLQVGVTYAIVGHNGNWNGDWDGRKRGAASCIFDADGNVMARSDSFWVSIADPG